MGQITLEEQATPSTPATDKIALYPKAGGGLYIKNDEGDEVAVGGGIANVVEDATPALGGNLDILEYSLHYDIALADDHSWTGRTFEATAGENLAIFETAYLKSDGKYWKTDANAVVTAGNVKVVITTAAINADASGVFLQWGWIRDDSTDKWDGTLAIADDMYLSASTTGHLTNDEDIPAGNEDIVRKVGNMETATILFFAPGQSWVGIVA